MHGESQESFLKEEESASIKYESVWYDSPQSLHPEHGKAVTPEPVSTINNNHFFIHMI
jgi:hypothetical protein